MSADITEPLQDRPEHGSDLEILIERVVERTIERVEQRISEYPFITSKACARLIGVTPEHLCAMRARGEGPSWSGDGRWIRYERIAVLAWLSSLPRDRNAPPEAT